MDSTTTTLVTALQAAISATIDEYGEATPSAAIMALCSFSSVLCHYLKTGIIADNEQGVYRTAKEIEALQHELRREEGTAH